MLELDESEYCKMLGLGTFVEVETTNVNHFLYDIDFSPSSVTTSHHRDSPRIMSVSHASARALTRQCARPQLTCLKAGVSAIQTRGRADMPAPSASYNSPISSESTKIPSFKKYRNSGGETPAKVFQYFMVGTMGAVTALGAKNTVQGENEPTKNEGKEVD